MNKCRYASANFIKANFRQHFCYRCGAKLKTTKHHKIVFKTSDEAKRYPFFMTTEGNEFESCDFIHNVLVCKKCLQMIEFRTQLSFENIDIVISKVQSHFKKRNRAICILKDFYAKDGELLENIYSLSDDVYLQLTIKEASKEDIVYKIPVIRSQSWERPYHFIVSKKRLIKFILNPKTEFTEAQHWRLLEKTSQIQRARWTLLFPLVGGLICYGIIARGAFAEQRPKEKQKIFESSFAILGLLLLAAYVAEQYAFFPKHLGMLLASYIFNLSILWHIQRKIKPIREKLCMQELLEQS